MLGLLGDQRGEHVGDHDLLATLAGECGYPADAVAAYLASGQDVAEVRAIEAKIRAMGIAMVPTFIVGGQRIVVGAEDPLVLASAIRQTLA